jgi:glycosyltransferase involved in cell wall biosynthesis
VSVPLTFYTYIPRNWNASFYYRIQVPFYTARDLGIPVRVHVDTNDAAIPTNDRVRAFCEADVVYLYQPAADTTAQNVRMVKSFVPSLRDGAWKYPPCVVVDTDDNLFNVSPYNPAYRGLGFRDHEGKPVPDRQLIGVYQNGEQKLLWHDGPCGKLCHEPGDNCQQRIDLARNRQTIQAYRNILNASDLVSCSTPHVRDCVTGDSKARRVEVFPNLVRFDHYEQVDLADDPKKIKILWQGGAAHYEDWYPLREALGNITRKYPEVHWIIWGQLYHWVTELIPAERYTFTDWCPYQEYKLRLVMKGHDINLAPLTDHRFNRCRSAIKFYEGSVLRKPAATLAQNTGAYKDEIIDGETALLFNNPQEFEQKLSLLIEDTKLRKTLAANAKDWVAENRDAFKMVPKMFGRIEEIRELSKREVPHMPEGEWEAFEQRIRKEAEQANAAQELQSTEA